MIQLAEFLAWRQPYALHRLLALFGLLELEPRPRRVEIEWPRSEREWRRLMAEPPRPGRGGMDARCGADLAVLETR